jgi:hypothetical protein
VSDRSYLAAALRGIALSASMFHEVGDDDLQEHLMRFAEATLMKVVDRLISLSPSKTPDRVSGYAERSALAASRASMRSRCSSNLPTCFCKSAR